MEVMSQSTAIYTNVVDAGTINSLYLHETFSGGSETQFVVL